MVKVSDVGLAVTASVSSLVTVTVTLAEGFASSATVYVSVLPPSVRLRDVGENANPRSSSSTVAVRSAVTPL